MHTFFVFIQYIGIIILVVEAFYVSMHKTSRYQQFLTLLIIALCINFVGYLLELQATTQGEALTAVKFLYLGKPYIAYAQFLFVMQVCKVKLSPKLVGALFCMHTAIVFLVLTCESHTLFYSSIEFADSGFFPHIVLGHGIIYNLYSMILVVYVIIMTAICISRRNNARRADEKRQFGYLILINIIPIVGFVIYLSGITRGYDITLLAYFIDTLLLSVLIFREKIFQTLALAKDLAIDSLAEGLVVVDNQEEVIYFNQKAKQIYERVSIGKCDAIL